MRKSKNIDLSVPRRSYYGDDCGLSVCPECGAPLIDEGCTILLWAKSEGDEGEFITSLSGSHFCTNCPAVVFDNNIVEQGALAGMKDHRNLRYAIRGIVDMEAIPKEKREMQIGIDENPIPLVKFLPDLKKKPTSKSDKKPGRNDPCPCGSGKKYKKCCA